MFKQKKEQNQIVLGRVSGSLWRKEQLSEAQLNHHVHVVGASGFGKTVLLSHIIQNRISSGKGLLFIDLKGDRETIQKFSKLALTANRVGDVKIFSLGESDISCTYNLIGSGTATQLRDRIMSSLEWSEEFYKNQSASFLLKILTVLCWLRDERAKPFDFRTLLECANSTETVADLCALIPEKEVTVKQLAEASFEFLNKSDNYKSLQGLRTQLESLVYSDFGGLLEAGLGGIQLFEAIAQQKLVFIFLDTRRYSETAKTIGRFILQDLKAASSRIDAEIPRQQRKGFSIIIDEFADLAQEDFIAFLDRARSSGLAVTVAHQEISDLVRISPEFAGRLMGNTSTLYAFLQKRPESAELISGIAGTRKAWKKTRQTERFGFLEVDTGKSSLREVDEFVIHPNLIKSLRVGKCVCVKKYPESRAYLVDVNAD